MMHTTYYSQIVEPNGLGWGIGIFIVIGFLIIVISGIIVSIFIGGSILRKLRDKDSNKYQ